MTKRKYPPVRLHYMVDIFFKVGPAVFSGGSMVPISFMELNAFNDRVMELTSWETETIVSMSGVYLKQRNRARNVNCPPPWEIVVEKEKDQKELSNQILAAMRKNHNVIRVKKNV